MNKTIMKTQKDNPKQHETDVLQEHYDFDYSKAKLNRFAERINQESVTILLDPDVAAMFPTSESVNEMLRVLMTAVQKMPATVLDRKQMPVAA